MNRKVNGRPVNRLRSLGTMEWARLAFSVPNTLGGKTDPLGVQSKLNKNGLAAPYTLCLCRWSSDSREEYYVGLLLSTKSIGMLYSSAICNCSSDCSCSGQLAIELMNWLLGYRV